MDKLNLIWCEHLSDHKLYDVLHTTRGRAVYSLMTYRGNHPVYSKWETDTWMKIHPMLMEYVAPGLII